jgi:hypothetical protein
MVLCAGLGPAEEPGTWRPCKLEKDHDSPCEPVPDPVQAELHKLRGACEEMGRVLLAVRGEIAHLRGVYFQSGGVGGEFEKGARHVVDRLEEVLEGASAHG